MRIMAGQIRGVGDKLKLAVIRKAMEKGQFKLIELLEEMDRKKQQVYMLSFPFQIYDLMEKMEEKGMRFNLGGDLYGMSEMNGLALDCEYGYKHLSPWIYPMVLDENDEPLGYGEEGRFAFLDPAANSYPGFIVTGDKVKLLESCPECGKEGIVIEGEISRMAGAEAKGCGNLMRDLMVEEIGVKS